MKEKSSFTSPIAIDLGAKHTGVYFAHFPTGSTLDQVGQSASGKVYSLPEDSKFTYLMANRTAKRHQKRSLDRRQMAKRLFRLVWEKHLKLLWDDDVQEAISFLLNRRGFTRPDETYSRDELRDMPNSARQQLIEVLELDGNDDERQADAILDDLVFKGFNAIETAHDAIARKTKPYLDAKKYSDLTQALVWYCSKKSDKTRKQARNRLRRVSKDVLDRWIENGIVRGLPQDVMQGKTFFNVGDWLDDGKDARLKAILETIMASGDLKTAKARKADIEKTKWGFNPSGFDLDKFHNRPVVDNEDDEAEMRWHLYHFSSAIHNTRDEMKSGGRPRNRYFDEISKVLMEREIKKRPGAIGTFCHKLRNEEYKLPGARNKPLDAKELTRLIGHISNLELKPLRKYFKDPAHKGKDYWDQPRLENIVHDWMFKQWRVDKHDRLKADDGPFPYTKLKKLWKEKSDGVIGFWLGEDPNYTIPPYQNNNNRGIPRCQSLLLNVRYLDDRYPSWRQEWLPALKELVPEVADFEICLRQLESGNRKNPKPYFLDTEELTGSKKVRSGQRPLQELDVRLLQFILDRTKARDPLNLKQIYHCSRNLRKASHGGNQRTKGAEKNISEFTEKLEKAINGSLLPKGWTDVWVSHSPTAPFPPDSFLHFAYAYYRMRERAEEGRIFIHPLYRPNPERGYEKTGKFYDKAHLLTYCNHKPRQKRYQMLGDVASLLRVPPKTLERTIHAESGDGTGGEASLSSPSHEGDLLVNWLKKSHGMKTACKNAAGEQKNRGSKNLTLDIQSVWRDATYGGLISGDRLHDGEKIPKKAIEEALRESTVPEAVSLLELSDKAVELCNQMAQSPHDSKSGDMPGFTPEQAVFALAQINNIAFDPRSGFSKTCPVCSEDNAFRSQMVQLEAGDGDLRARSQRLPAIPNRVIDGAVRRMSRIVSAAIADDKWQEIERDIMAGKQVRVRVPIVMESNRFEFDRQLRQWIKKDTGKKGLPERNLFDEKRLRVKRAGYCPYTDEKLDEGAVEDHIVPRKSEWGTINDEANLVGATKHGNDEKGNKRYDLSKLRPKYKKAAFGPLNLSLNLNDDKAIEDWIVSTLCAEDGSFRFGNYVSFSSLQQAEQIAFRHALFLPERHDELRNRVIRAMNNRMRTLVNGTQRYFAETLAGAIYRKAMRVRKESQLSFDYYDVEAKSNSRGRGVHDLRELYAKHDSIIRDNAKKDNKRQEDYSHLIDAQLAFVIAADAHRNGGGMGIDIPDNIGVAPTNNDGADGILHYVRVSDFNLRPLKRRETSEGFFAHRTLFDSEPRAWHFLKLIEITDGESNLHLQGFLDLHCLEKCLKETDWADALGKIYGHHLVEGDASSAFLSYGRPVKGKATNAVKALYTPDQFGCSKKRDSQPKTIFSDKDIEGRAFTVKLHQIDHEKVAEFLLDRFNTDTAPETISEADIKTYQMLFNTLYFTKREKITKEAIAEAMAKIPQKFQFQKLCDPSLIKKWSRVAEMTRECEDDDLEDVLKKKLFPPSGNLAMHEAVRKHFSLPVKSEGQGFMLIRRHSWQGKAIYQLQSQKDGDSGAGLFEKKMGKTGAYDSLRPHFRAKNIVLIRKWDDMRKALTKDGTSVDKDKWHQLPDSDVDKANETIKKFTKNRIEMLENKYISKGDSMYRVKFDAPIRDMASLISLMKAGLQIDEMNVGRQGEAKSTIDKWLKSFFGNGQNKKGWLSIQHARDKLEREIGKLREIQNNRDQPPLTESQKAGLKRMRKWLEWIGCIQKDKTVVEYKRGVGLKIGK